MLSFLKKLYYRKLGAELADCKTVLDVGCGNSSILEHIPGDFHSTGLDAYVPYLEESRQKGIHDDYIEGNIETVRIPSKSYDAIISFHVIEHLEKQAALKFIAHMEGWAKKKVILATPNGFVPTLVCHKRGIADLDHLQEHKSGWTVEDLESLGYRVRGQNGLKWLAGEGKARTFLYYLSAPLGYIFPRAAFSIVAIKTLLQ